MKIERYEKGSFAVIGKEGSTTDGTGFIQRLWEDANSHFEEIQHLAKKGRDGTIAGIWGAMSDFSRTFNPWEDFSRGLYLAGVECELDAEAPDGWCETEHSFSDTIQYLHEHNLTLAGAVQDFTCPQTGINYMLFPIRKL